LNGLERSLLLGLNLTNHLQGQVGQSGSVFTRASDARFDDVGGSIG
jgi:hypothetical protein